MKRTWIHHAIIVNEGRRFAGSVVIEGEKIQEVIEGNGAPAAVCDEQIDAQGCFLLPGVIDDHVHFRDPGLTHKADSRPQPWRHWKTSLRMRLPNVLSIILSISEPQTTMPTS